MLAPRIEGYNNLQETLPQTAERRKRTVSQVEMAPWRNGLLKELLLTVPTEGTWEEVLNRVEAKLLETKNSQLGRSAQITLHLGDRLLSLEELEAFVHHLKQAYGLLTVAVVATDMTTQEAVRRLTLNAYTMQPGSNLLSTAGEEASGNNALYIPKTVRSGQRVVHQGTLIIGADVNAGAEVVATGEIMVFGSLRGIAHAGSEGDTQARIIAGNMRPQQIRIADKIARAPEDSPNTRERFTEVARIENGEITVVPY